MEGKCLFFSAPSCLMSTCSRLADIVQTSFKSYKTRNNNPPSLLPYYTKTWVVKRTRPGFTSKGQSRVCLLLSDIKRDKRYAWQQKKFRQNSRTTKIESSDHNKLKKKDGALQGGGLLPKIYMQLCVLKCRAVTEHQSSHFMWVKENFLFTF